MYIYVISVDDHPDLLVWDDDPDGLQWTHVALEHRRHPNYMCFYTLVSGDGHRERGRERER